MRRIATCCLWMACASAGERLQGAGFTVEGRDRHVCEALKGKLEAAGAWKDFLSSRPSGARLHVRSMRSVRKGFPAAGGSYWPGSAVLTVTVVDAASGAVLLHRTARGETPAVVRVQERAPAGGPAERIAELERQDREGSRDAQEAALRAAESGALEKILGADPAKPEPVAPHPAPGPAPERPARQERAKPRPKPEPAPDPARQKELLQFIKDLSSKEALARGIAVRGLGRFGPEAAQALPALMKLHQSPLGGVKREEPDAKGLRPDVRKRMEESEARQRKQEEAIREKAVEAVARIGPATKEAVGFLVKVLLETPESPSRKAVVSTRSIWKRRISFSLSVDRL